MVDMPSPLASLWKDRCTIFIKKKVTDTFTKLTDFMEIPVINEEPCKLSFQTLAVNGEGDTAAMVAQSVKLFLSPDLEIPAGCKIVVKRFGTVEREFIYARSGEPGIFSNHQEVPLTTWKEYA